MSSLQMFDDGDGEGAGSGSHSYFIPMVDMLAGVVFILIILLAANSLVSRNDFGETNAAQQKIQKIRQELAEAKSEEARYLAPRRAARQALTTLLTRLRDRLEKAGFAARIEPDDGRLLVAGSAFSDGSSELDANGRRLAGVLTDGLAAEIPCLAAIPPAKTASCDLYEGATLGNAILEVTPSGGSETNLAEIRALQMLTAIASRKPALLALQAADGHRLLSTRAGTGPVPSGGPSQRANAEPGFGSKQTETWGQLASLQFVFQMSVPFIP